MTEILALQQLEADPEPEADAAYPCLSIFASHFYETL
ncbi:class III lanthipeptide [Kitasatospora sp. NPDC049285]